MSKKHENNLVTKIRGHPFINVYSQRALNKYMGGPVVGVKTEQQTKAIKEKLTQTWRGEVVFIEQSST